MLGVLVILVILWVYLLQYYKITPLKYHLSSMISTLKTGDIILFKAYNNFNSIFHGSYFGHMGMIYVLNGTPMLFEANGIEHMNLLPSHPQNGVFLTPVADRIKKYKGRTFLKRLNARIDKNIEDDFGDFIDYCKVHFYYDTSILPNVLKNGLGIKRCDYATHCGQIVYLSLIKLALLPIEYYDLHMFNHLNYVAYLDKLSGDYSYEPIVEIIDHPFDK